MICQTGEMDEARASVVMAESVGVLRNAGARFAYLHGSRASGQYRPDSDIDIAAYFGGGVGTASVEVLAVTVVTWKRF
jgi:predicted nucleotidyltransferase